MAARGRKASEPAQHILFLMTDQHRVDTLGAYGNTAIETPALDALAAQGTRFESFYTPTAICTRPGPPWPPASTPSGTACWSTPVRCGAVPKC